MNVVQAKVVDGGANPALVIGAQTLQLDDAAVARLPGLRTMIGRTVAFGMRPEALGKEGTGSLNVQVELVEMLGAELLVHATIDAPLVRQTDDGVEVGHDLTSMVVASMDPRHRVQVGDRVALTVDTSRIHLFDMDTGNAIGFSVEDREPQGSAG
ncbi:MAG: hypothetical protein ABIR32_16695 [Ilumatobacteraceae bacterium]